MTKGSYGWEATDFPKIIKLVLSTLSTFQWKLPFKSNGPIRIVKFRLKLNTRFGTLVIDLLQNLHYSIRRILQRPDIIFGFQYMIYYISKLQYFLNIQTKCWYLSINMQIGSVRKLKNDIRYRFLSSLRLIKTIGNLI